MALYGQTGGGRKNHRFYAALFIGAVVLYSIFGQHQILGFLTPSKLVTQQECAEAGFRFKPQQTTGDESGHQIPRKQDVIADAESTDGNYVPEKQATIGKVTISFGDRDETYERAIKSHELHNKNMGYTQFVLRERLMSGLWTKHAYIFSVVAQELSKPEGERLKWIVWLDRDTVLMNPLLPLEAFLPPPELKHIHLLAANDRHGLNNGVFFLKVNDWSLKLFAAALSFHHYRPDIPLKYTEQSAMEEVLKEPWYARSTAIVPQHWFNAFPPPAEGAPLLLRHARPGSLLIHFASDRDGLRAERMNQWMDIADKQTPKWSVPLNETFYPANFEEYWRRLAAGDTSAAILKDMARLT